MACIRLCRGLWEETWSSAGAEQGLGADGGEGLGLCKVMALAHMGRAAGALDPGPSPSSLTFLWGVWELLRNALPSCQVNQKGVNGGPRSQCWLLQRDFCCFAVFVGGVLLLQLKKI